MPIGFSDSLAISDSLALELIVVENAEIAQKVGLGKWPEMAPYLDRLKDLLDSQRGVATALEAADCLVAGTMDWPHRDAFGRFLAASALRRRIPIVSADTAFDALLTRIW